MLTDNDISEILAVRHDHGSDAAFTLLDARMSERGRAPTQLTDIIGVAIDMMAETLAP